MLTTTTRSTATGSEGSIKSRRSRSADLPCAVRALLIVGAMGMVLLTEEIACADLSTCSIQRVYMVAHAHLDIGFNWPPDETAAQYKTMVNSQVTFANNASHKDYRWTIEETWQAEQFLKRCTATQTNNFVKAVTNGQIRVSGGHSTLHSSKAGAEVVNRLLWNAARYRNRYGFKIETVFNDDVPAACWSYPQVLAKSGIKYLVMGENLFIGGGISQPWNSYIFRWQGPDGSRVLTWSARGSYAEGAPIFWWTSPVAESLLTTTLTNLTAAGYPYDAVMIQTAFDNSEGTTQYGNATNWNNTHSNPQIIVATAEEFFEYMEAKYGPVIPVRTGNWVSVWDTSGVIGPNEIKIAKNGQTLLAAAEQMNALANDRGLGGYDPSRFTTGWDQILQIYEHSGPGPCASNYMNQADLDTNNWEYRQYALEALAVTTGMLASGLDALLTAAAVSNADSVVVYNSLSWTRTDLARIPLGSALMAEEFTLRDAVTGQTVPYQKDPAAATLLFVARDVPPVGFRRYAIEHTAAPAVTNRLSISARTNENSRFRVVLDNWGYISSIFDKEAGRQVVDTGDACQFNRMIQASNGQWFFGLNSVVSNPVASPVFTVTRNGPVAASLRVTRAGHPHADAEVTLYDGLDRIDIVDTPDRSNMLYAAVTDNSRYYGLTFPFNLTNAEARIDTAAGWCNPRTDMLAGSYKGAFAIQNGLDLSETGYGVTLATPDVTTHAFGGFQGNGVFPPPNPTVVSTFIRYADEAYIKPAGKIGRVTDEPGASNRWDLYYAVHPHIRGFDAVADARFGWEICSPLQGRVVAASPGGVLGGSALTFLTVDVPNVLITSIKKAEFGTGLIVKLQEIGGVKSNRVTLTSEAFGFARVQPVTPLEAETGVPLVSKPMSQPAPGKVGLTMGAREIACLRIITAPLAPPPPAILMFSKRGGSVMLASTSHTRSGAIPAAVR